MAKLVVDFTDAEKGGGRIRVPEDDYRAKVKNVKVDTSKAGNTMLVWDFEISEGKHKGKSFKDYTTLTVESAWKLKNILEAMGLKVPTKKLDITPLLKKAKGKELGVTLVDDEYEKKISSKPGDYMDLDTLEEAVDDDEDEDDEDDEDEEDDDTDDDDEEDDEEEEEEKPKKKAKKGKKKKKKKEDDDEDIEDLDVDEL